MSSGGEWPRRESNIIAGADFDLSDCLDDEDLRQNVYFDDEPQTDNSWVEAVIELTSSGEITSTGDQGSLVQEARWGYPALKINPDHAERMAIPVSASLRGMSSLAPASGRGVGNVSGTESSTGEDGINRGVISDSNFRYSIKGNNNRDSSIGDSDVRDPNITDNNFGDGVIAKRCVRESGACYINVRDSDIEGNNCRGGSIGNDVARDSCKDSSRLAELSSLTLALPTPPVASLQFPPLATIMSPLFSNATTAKSNLPTIFQHMNHQDTLSESKLSHPRPGMSNPSVSGGDDQTGNLPNLDLSNLTGHFEVTSNSFERTTPSISITRVSHTNLQPPSAVTDLEGPATSGIQGAADLEATEGESRQTAEGGTWHTAEGEPGDRAEGKPRHVAEGELRHIAEGESKQATEGEPRRPRPLSRESVASSNQDSDVPGWCSRSLSSSSPSSYTQSAEEDEDEEDAAKTVEKREKNRVAAQKSRDKKRMRVEQLEKEVSRLEQRQDRLQQNVCKLQDEKEMLEEALRVHSLVCPNLGKTPEK